MGTQAMLAFHLERRTDPANGLRTARKLRELARDYGEQRFEEACIYASKLNIVALRSIESILKHAPGRLAPPSPKADLPVSHEHVRGATYFGDQS
jgi:hypothetical protein